MRSHKDLVELLCENGAPVDAVNEVVSSIKILLNSSSSYCHCGVAFVTIWHYCDNTIGWRYSSSSCCKAKLSSHH